MDIRNQKTEDRSQREVDMDIRPKIIKEFCEENFELLQDWLEEREIESSEAEWILAGLEEDDE